MKDTSNIYVGTRENTFKCIISSTDSDEWVLINSIPNLIELDIFDGIFLSDNTTNFEKVKLPKDKGVYKCDITISQQVSYCLDCSEYDMDISIDNIELIITLP